MLTIVSTADRILKSRLLYVFHNLQAIRSRMHTDTHATNLIQNLTHSRSRVFHIISGIMRSSEILRSLTFSSTVLSRAGLSFDSRCRDEGRRVAERVPRRPAQHPQPADDILRHRHDAGV